MSTTYEIKALVESQGREWRDEYGRVVERLDQLETAFNRRGLPVATKAGEPAAETKAFLSFLRRGTDALEPVERKLLRVSDEPSGGYLVAPTMATDILRLVAQASPVRQLATLRTGAGPSFVQPRQVGNVTAAWLAEVETTPESTPSFGQVEIPAHRLGAYTEVSNALLGTVKLRHFRYIICNL